jgi:hypothetical protein
MDGCKGIEGAKIRELNPKLAYIQKMKDEKGSDEFTSKITGLTID